MSSRKIGSDSVAYDAIRDTCEVLCCEETIVLHTVLVHLLVTNLLVRYYIVIKSFIMDEASTLSSIIHIWNIV